MENVTEINKRSNIKGEFLLKNGTGKNKDGLGPDRYDDIEVFTDENKKK